MFVAPRSVHAQSGLGSGDAPARKRSQRHGAASTHGAADGALGSHTQPGGHVGQGCQCGHHVGAIAAHLNAQCALPCGWQHGVGLKNLANALRQAQALQARSRQHNGLVLTLVQLAQARVQIAAQRLNAHIGAPQSGQGLTQQHQAAQAGGAHHGIGGQIGHARAVGRHPGITRVFALHHTCQCESWRKFHGHVFQRMHRQVGATFLKRGFQFFHKQAFSAHLAQSAVQNLVAPGGHAQQRDCVAQSFQQGLDVFGLPQRQTAFPGGNGQVQARSGSDLGHGGESNKAAENSPTRRRRPGARAVQKEPGW